MKQTKVFVDVNKLMKHTDYGRDIYEMLLPDLQREDDNRYKKTFNPFYTDTNPSLSVYKGENGWWRHHDFGDSSFTGDAIELALLRYDLDRKTQFGDLLRRIVDDLKIDPELVAKEGDNTPFMHEWWKDEEGLDIAYNYFFNYGITKDILKRFAVRGVRKYPVVDEDGKLNWRYPPKGKITIAYEDVNHTKLYTPGAEKKFKFEFVGRKPQDFIFGKGQILTNIHRTKNYDRGPLIITGGEKDVLTLTALGYDTITLNSETANIPPHLVGFLEFYDKVIVLYDIDETGKVNAAKLASKHNLSVCTLPDELRGKGGKDVSDYIKLGMPVDPLHELIRNSSTPISMPDIPEQETISEESEPESKASSGDLSNTPLLPDEVYSLLPQMLKSLCGQFDDRRERDVNLLSCLTVMSSCFPTIKGIYGELPIGCNINLFITAPASAGKGIMSWSRILGNPINRMLKLRFKEAYRQYERDLISYRSRQEGIEMEKPKEPVQERLFIPANSSCSSIYEYLDANQNFGIIFDNEGDTLSSIMKNDWGDYSTLIRKAFHHEHTSMARRKDREHREIETPHLSLLLSGTRNQVTKLIDSVENGLFSRFIFYDFDSKIEWRDMFGDGDYSTKKAFEMQGEQLLNYWKKGEETGETVYLLDEGQRKTITNYFTKKLQEMYSVYGEDIVANVKRICIIYYRIAMLLSTIHNYEAMNLHINKMPGRMTLNDDQSRCALLIVDTLLTHLEFVFTRIQRTGAVSKLNFKQRSLYDTLPKEFTWQEFLSIAEEASISNAATQKYRRDFINAKLIMSPAHGKFRKI